jgi:Sulfotransferase family
MHRNRQKVIIIGAARTGTNMLRDILTSLEGIETWPCDEIPFIWRYGNARYPHDEFGPEMASDRSQKYIEKAFSKIAWQRNATRVVEKTCANSLRVAYVDRIIPDSKYLYLNRDGRDAIASAKKRWTSQIDLKYLARKARYVPTKDFAYYMARFVKNRIAQKKKMDSRLSTWGPRFKGMEKTARERTLQETCAIQWSRCVMNSERDFANMSQDKMMRIKYEEFVTAPKEEMKRILNYLEVEVDDSEIERAVRNVHAGSVGKGTEKKRNEIIDEIIAEAMEKTGYRI